MTVAPGPAPSVVVCSLEPWDATRRRIRILVDEFAESDPQLRVLYVAPPVDVPFEISRGRTRDLVRPVLEQVHPRIHVLRPRKWLPRILGPAADRSLGRQVSRAVSDLDLSEPLLWVNDAAYARFALATDWPTVYDVTDDWLLAPMPPRQEARVRADDDLLLHGSGAVVVCSPDLARTRGARRTVDLIPNGVDVELFRTPQPRPAALPDGPVAVYVGTLHEERVDIPLLLELAAARPDVTVALVGHDSLGPDASAQLDTAANIVRVGPQPYESVPGFLQHADLVVIPHLVNPFTESLDPIKAYECLATGRPTVATPVAGFRDLAAPIVVADRRTFVATAVGLLDNPPAPTPPADVPTWRQRADDLAAVMHRVRTVSGAA